jgi:hypothetical protein
MWCVVERLAGVVPRGHDHRGNDHHHPPVANELFMGGAQRRRPDSMALEGSAHDETAASNAQNASHSHSQTQK